MILEVILKSLYTLITASVLRVCDTVGDEIRVNDTVGYEIRVNDMVGDIPHSQIP